jgi:protein SCO1/2
MKRFLMLLMLPLLCLSTFNVVQAKESTKDTGAAKSKEPAAEPAKEKNVFSLAGQWKTAKNETVELSKFKGKKTIVALFYASCSTICPMTTASIKRVMTTLDKEKVDAQVLLVSIDAGDQNTKQMADFAKNQKLEAPQWNLLAGNAEQTTQLAALLGLGIGEKRSSPDLHQMHSEFLVLVDENGKVILQTPSFNPNIPQVVKALSSKSRS